MRITAYNRQGETGGDMKRIVLVDDDENLLKVYRFFLSKEGYEITTFGNARDALQYVSDGQAADLFILDVELPDMSGLELMQQIRNRMGVVRPPIIISSGYEQYKNNFNSWLADDYLIKQPDLNSLKAKVHSFLA